MVAYGRDNNSIAKKLGADRIIFQTLDDLNEACIEAARDSGREWPHTFEVGVFCGRYITPVPDGYLDHLDAVRGAAKETKSPDRAIDALALGLNGNGRSA
jgi:amidophosphoribosyltransferase